jgi:hypothetical protein
MTKRKTRKRLRMINKFSPDQKDKIIIMGFLLLIVSNILSLSVGTALGFSLAKSVRINIETGWQ